MRAERDHNSENVRHRVLIIDASTNLRTMVRLSLEQAGLDSIEAATGEEALELMALESQSNQIAAIICEVKLPGMGGHEVIRRFREHWPQVCIIVFTADVDMEIAHELLRLGVHRYMLKPAFPEEVSSAVLSAISEHQPSRTARPPRNPKSGMGEPNAHIPSRRVFQAANECEAVL